jgi:hypothetical protein
MDYSYITLREPTFVTGLWDIGRGSLENTTSNYDWGRSFEKYTSQLESLLSTGLNIVVYGDKPLLSVVNKYPNATFVEYDQSEFYKCWFYEKVNKIRLSKEWYDQPTAKWLKNSPQAKLALYLPIQFSKLYFIEKTIKSNPYNSSHFYWLDAGITKNHDIDLLRGMIPKLLPYKKFMFLSLLYRDNTEIHGFLREGVHKYCKMPFVERIMKGFFFGGNTSDFYEILNLYKDIISKSLDEGYLGADETIFTIMSYQRNDLFDKVLIETCDNVTRYL